MCPSHILPTLRGKLSPQVGIVMENTQLQLLLITQGNPWSPLGRWDADRPPSLVLWPGCRGLCTAALRRTRENRQGSSRVTSAVGVHPAGAHAPGTGRPGDNRR